MPKLGMGPIRKAQLIKATFDCIHQYGFAGTTIMRISNQAGVSAGIISHYFDGKEGLLEATMRDLLKLLGRNAQQRTNLSDDPKGRIIAIINSNFAEQQITPEAVTVWLAFWGRALHDPALARLQKINIRRLRSNLRYWLRKLLPREPAFFTADGLAALIDGLWLRGAFQEEGIQREEARDICLDYVNLQLEKSIKQEYYLD